jgi:hypothetical protein
MTGVHLRRALVLSAAVALVGTAGAAAKQAGSTHPARLPVTFNLPAGWATSATAPGARYDASAGSGYGRLEVTTGGSFPSSLPFSEFVKTETTSARSAYRAKDPKAVVSATKVSLPGGNAVEIHVTLHTGTPLAIYLYSFLNHGVTYHFTYFTNASTLGTFLPGFKSSARSIHFTK